MSAFATVGQLEASWHPLTAEERATATVRLEEASTVLRALKPDIDDLVWSEALDASIPRFVVIDMVKRSMTTPEAMSGVNQASQSVGPFSQSFQFANPDGNLYLTKLHKQMLGMNDGEAFTFDMMAAPVTPVIEVW